MERHVVKGLQRFGQFLQSERSRFAAAPVLLIQGKDARREPTDTACRHVEFILSKQLGFRTVMSHSCSDSVFATTSMVEEQHELVARTGATTVCAVGNQAAMDVAKAVVSSQEEDCNELILVPVTYESILACSQPHSLLLDTVEDALLVESMSLSCKIPTTLAMLESPNVDTSGQINALFASISLALDAMYQDRSSRKNTDHSSRITSLLTKTVDLLVSIDNISSRGDNNNNNTHDAVVECLLLAGDLTSFGISIDSGNRSIPLGVAASLMPQVFPNEDILTVMASLVPALCDSILTRRSNSGSSTNTSIGDGGREEAMLDLIARINAMDTKPKSLVTTEPLGSLLSLVQGNRLLWNCFDAPDDDYAELLRNHVLV